jgi:hypothetical protein
MQDEDGFRHMTDDPRTKTQMADEKLASLVETINVAFPFNLTLGIPLFYATAGMLYEIS